MRVFFSNRIYKKDLDISTVSAINKLIGDYSSILHFAYKEIVSDARYGPDVVSLYFRVENKYPDVLTYIRNTAIQDAKGIHASRMQLLKEQRRNRQLNWWRMSFCKIVIKQNTRKQQTLILI